MCYLLQSLTEQLLDDKIAFAAEEREALRKELRKKSDRLDAYVRACGADAPERAEAAAAVKIQAAARSRAARKRADAKRREREAKRRGSAATRIQAAHRGNMARKKVKEMKG